MIKSCVECPQYVVKEIEPGLPAFCLYWREGISLESPTCRNYNEGRIPEEPVFSLSDLPTAPPQCGQEGSGNFQSTSQLPDRHSSHQGNGDIVPSSQKEPGASLHPGQHLVKILSVQGVKYNFKDYIGAQARLKMKVLSDPDAGKFIFDNISLPHPEESKGMFHRRVRIAYRLGLIPWGAKETIRLNWKELEGVVCWVDVAYKNLGGRKVLTVDNYELQDDWVRKTL